MAGLFSVKRSIRFISSPPGIQKTGRRQLPLPPTCFSYFLYSYSCECIAGLHATCRLRQSCVSACLLCRAVRKQLIKIFCIALFWSHDLPEFLHKYFYHRSYLIFLVIVS